MYHGKHSCGSLPRRPAGPLSILLAMFIALGMGILRLLEGMAVAILTGVGFIKLHTSVCDGCKNPDKPNCHCSTREEEIRMYRRMEVFGAFEGVQ